MSEILDSGERREFKTGAVRDIQEGKGRCDLLPLGIAAEVLESCYSDTSDEILYCINDFILFGDRFSLIHAIHEYLYGEQFRRETALLELAKHYEDGCKKYGERNWEKGINVHCYIDSAVRHYLKYRRGDDDERHDRAFLWNLFGALWTLDNLPELDDVPHRYKGEKKSD